MVQAEEVVITIDTLYSDSTSECCLQLLGDTLLLYRAPTVGPTGAAAGAAAIAVPDRVKEVAKKIINSFKIAAVSGTKLGADLLLFLS